MRGCLLQKAQANVNFTTMSKEFMGTYLYCHAQPEQHGLHKLWKADALHVPWFQLYSPCNIQF